VGLLGVVVGWGGGDRRRGDIEGDGRGGEIGEDTDCDRAYE